MKTRNIMGQTTGFAGTACIVGTVFYSLLAPATYAGQRGFLVVLATSPKQFQGAGPPIDLPDAEEIRKQYFDTTAGNDIGSFAEYWEEISYRDVTIAGIVTDWLDLPWAIRNDRAAQFYDLNRDGAYTYGIGETVIEFERLAIDLDGDPDDVDDGPFSGALVDPEKTSSGEFIWYPGERFVDMDEDGRWDGLDEANNRMDFFGVVNRRWRQVADFKPDRRGPWVDLNDDGVAENKTNCVYLPDSDNDGFLDCCPDGPGKPGCNGRCAPHTLEIECGGDTVEITDCNGNLIPDSCDVSCRSTACLDTCWLNDPRNALLCGGSTDFDPFEDDGATCAPTPGNGIPDECEWVNMTEQGCVATEVTEETDNCYETDVCIRFVTPTPDRCEFDDSNGDDELDIVEPFENFLRRWDPCLFDPDVSGPGNHEKDAVHWIKVYDPNSDAVALTCDDPPQEFYYQADTTRQPKEICDPARPQCDPNSPLPGELIPNPLYKRSYIENNYPGDFRAVEDQTRRRLLWGVHDPTGSLDPCLCRPSCRRDRDCADDLTCIDGTCRCASDDDCPGGTGTCTHDTCVEDANCRGGTTCKLNPSTGVRECEYGLCECVTDPILPAEDDACWKDCTTDADCGWVICVGEPSSCPAPPICVDKACRTPCDFDRDCGPNIRCDPDARLCLEFSTTIYFDPTVSPSGACRITLQNACPAGFHAQYDPPLGWINSISAYDGEDALYTTKMRAAYGALSGTAGFVDVGDTVRTPEPWVCAGSGEACELDEQAVLVCPDACDQFGNCSPTGPCIDRFDQEWRDRYVGGPDVTPRKECARSGTPCASDSDCQGTDRCIDLRTGCENENFDETFPPGANNRRFIACEPPAWLPAPLEHTLRMEPFDDTDPDVYADDQEFHRRFFKANEGGLHGNGNGWDDNCGTAETGPSVLFESGRVSGFQLSFVTACNHPVLPDEREGGVGRPGQYYDGWVEHDDVPSSKYHGAGDQRFGEVTSPFSGDIWGEDRGRHDPNQVLLPDHFIPAAGPYAVHIHGAGSRDAGNLLMWELLSWRTEPPFNNGVVWESQHGTHPFAGPRGDNIGFRDYNLDGMVDQGEVRPAGSDNYVVDPSTFTTNNGYSTSYPWHRERLIEDCIEILDAAIDFDDFTDRGAMNSANRCQGPMTINRSSDLMSDPFGHHTRFPEQFATGDNQQDIVIGAGILSGVVLLPPGSPGSGGSAVADQGFPTIGPDFWPIHTEDGLHDVRYMDANMPPGANAQLSWHLFSHDMVLSLPMVPEAVNFLTGTAADMYLDAWENFPNLWDHGRDAGEVVNCPMAGFDIEAEAGLIHPSAPFKEFSCTEWIQPVDLRTVLTPGVETTVTLPPAEKNRDDSYYYIENEAREGERLYFWSAGTGFDEPGHPTSGGIPRQGVLILHADPGANPEATPVQQNFPPYSYTIVQADGLDELGAGHSDNMFCDNIADGGDVWPGSTGNTTFDCDTLPASLWNSGTACTGLEISNIVLDGAGGAAVTMVWWPQEIPVLGFANPPGGVSVDLPGDAVIYYVRADVADLYGGTWLRYFYVEDGEEFEVRADGSNFIGMAQKRRPGQELLITKWNIAGIDDGRYRVFAELIPGQGADASEMERAYGEPHPGRSNRGDGTLTIDKVNTSVVRRFGTTRGQFVTIGGKTVFEATDDSGAAVVFTAVAVLSDVVPGDQLTVHDAVGHTAYLRTVVRVVTGTGGPNTGLELNTGVPSSFNVSSWLVARSGSTARSETWALSLDKVEGLTQTWNVFSTLTQPAPDTAAGELNPWNTLKLTVDPTTNQGSKKYTSEEGAVEFTLTNDGAWFQEDDIWSFTTTGITALSATVTINGQQINEAPIAVIFVDRLSGDPPLTVKFDGRGSRDPNGAPLEYDWDFGDGSPSAAGPLQTHTYTDARTFTARLTVTAVTDDALRLFGEASVDIIVTNNSPRARFVVSPQSGGKTELQVSFDASDSSDTETPADDLVYQWDFGDGTGGNDAGIPGTLITTVHLYTVSASAPCIRGEEVKQHLDATALAEALKDISCYTAALTVTDNGGKSNRAVMGIEVGNTLPVPGITPASARIPEGETVTFNAMGSFDPDPGDKVMVLWDFGDGSEVKGPYPLTGPSDAADGRVIHEYDKAGSFTPRATLFDTKGGTSVWTGKVIVSDDAAGESAPKADFRLVTAHQIDADAGQLVVLVDVPVEVDASLSYDRPAGDPIVQYRWDWGDGSDEDIGRAVAHTYSEVGDYDITLMVFDGENPPNADDAVKFIRVKKDTTPLPGENEPPSASFVADPSEGVVGEAVIFNAGSSSDPNGDVLSFEWSFGDRTSGVGAVVSHVYTEPGSYLVRVTVRDTHGATSMKSQRFEVTASVLNLAPQVFIGFIDEDRLRGPAPLIIEFDGSNSYDPDGPDEELTFAWRVNNVILGTERQLRLSFTVPGTHRVQLEVTDTHQALGVSEVLIVEVLDGLPPGDIEPPRIVPGGSGSGGGSSSGQFCGLGMIMGLVGSLLGLFVMMAARRRSLL